MARGQLRDHIIFKWLSLKSTIDYIGEWELSADLREGNDIGAVDAHELRRRQHILNGLHGEVGDEGLTLAFEVEHHVIL